MSLTMTEHNDLLSADDMAKRAGLYLTEEQRKFISSGLAQLSRRRSLTVGTTRTRTSTDNPNHDPTKPASSKNPRKFYQSYEVNTYHISLCYEFEQLCIILGLM